MLTVRIALCEDDPHCREQITQMVEAWLRRRPDLEGSAAVFENGEALLDALAAGEQFHLYLLDVLMPGRNGIQTAEALRQQEDTGEIIYLTSTPDFAVESYGVGAFFYLLKPAQQEKLFAVLDNAVRHMELHHGASIIVPTAEGDHRLLLDDILYVEYQRRRARYVCVAETVDSLVLRNSFKETVGPLLEDGRFCMCGASFAVNLRRVRIVDGQSAHLTGGVKVVLPRTSNAEFKRLWGEFWLREGLRG